MYASSRKFQSKLATGHQSTFAVRDSISLPLFPGMVLVCYLYFTILCHHKWICVKSREKERLCFPEWRDRRSVGQRVPPRESPDVVGTAAQLRLRHRELRRAVTDGGKALCTGDCLELGSKGG